MCARARARVPVCVCVFLCLCVNDVLSSAYVCGWLSLVLCRLQPCLIPPLVVAFVTHTVNTADVEMYINLCVVHVKGCTHVHVGV